jgi:hypothetical protein
MNKIRNVLLAALALFSEFTTNQRGDSAEINRDAPLLFWCHASLKPGS